MTITEDCFYILDASATYVDSPGVASTNSRRVALEILDLAGKTCWSLAYTTVSVFQTAVGLLSVGAAPVQTLRLHLLKDMVVQWRVIDAGTGNSAVGAGIALRKLAVKDSAQIEVDEPAAQRYSFQFSHCVLD